MDAPPASALADPAGPDLAGQAPRPWRRLLLVLVLLAAVGLFFLLGLHRYLRLATIKDSHDALVGMYRASPVLFTLGFMGLHVLALGLCLPGAVLTVALAGGAIFGPLLGIPIVLTSLTMGDSLGFLAARTLIGDFVRRRFAAQVGRIEREVERNGALYLLSLRLMAGIPYFVVNLAFGVTRMRLRTFAPVSFIGLAPATAIYVNAGTQLSKIQSAGDVLSPAVVVSLGLLAAVPLATRLLVRRTARRSATG